MIDEMNEVPIYLVTSEEGWYDLMTAHDCREAAIWLSKTALSDGEFERYKEKGFNMTRLAYDVTTARFAETIEEIKLHHPLAQVWVHF
ncbi:hypothetical protein ABAC460_04725 [Asticcacaulis sp. AC460]|uniref:hypothetical protein n=1 Tax=Asticcacaulis sp. AC460 TaxID=1282360 RepID=UPI0003C41277|nr:hypothetical protein [Asticcacaulis sp. AC460]ESQ92197.1 hypothetical protein ABAC460_04725 [Asticcacaulis sp. AC460]